ncbi:hypothetical protein NKDENANG_01164 [Candidatus Entotheonellaceae bacterium PAL068K]
MTMHEHAHVDVNSLRLHYMHGGNPVNHNLLLHLAPLASQTIYLRNYLSGAVEVKVLLDKLPVKKEPLCEVTKGGLKGICFRPKTSGLVIQAMQTT